MAGHVLEMRGIVRRFPGVTALDGALLEVRPGEVHCLLGENGAGKSTLMKILAGALPPDAGEVLIDGVPVRPESPIHAQRLGVGMIYQEFNLVPWMTVAENIYLGREPRRGGGLLLDRAAMRAGARELLARIGADIDPARAVNSLSVAGQQMVEIARALSVNARIIVMDEPSATLTDHELAALFALIRELRGRGIAIIYISHRLDEVFEIGDRATIMRDGRHIATRPVAELTREEIIRLMVGRTLHEEYPKEFFPRGAERLRATGLTRPGVFENVSLSLHAGEIVGLTGLVGSRRTEVARALFGADGKTAGTVLLDGAPSDIRSPRDAIRLGVGLLTEDRKGQGLVLGMSVMENTTLANLSPLVRWGLIRGAAERAAAERFVEDLQIKTPGTGQLARNLSGGNQQKLVLAKWLFTESRVLIFDEPTRGVDVGAKTEIFRLMNALVARGVAVLMISSELPEVLGMCDRVLVMHEGRLAGELSRAEATQESVMRLATGGGANHAA